MEKWSKRAESLFTVLQDDLEKDFYSLGLSFSTQKKDCYCGGVLKGALEQLQNPKIICRPHSFPG
jgi:hypothetical protein